MVPHLLFLSVFCMLSAASLAMEPGQGQNPTDKPPTNYSPVAQNLSFSSTQGTAPVFEDVKPAVLAKKIKRAQLKFYRVFNELNELDEYDIICKRRGSLSNSSKYKVCEPAYSRKLRLHLENANNARSSSNFERFRQLTEENNKNALAQLIRLLNQHSELKQQYSHLLAMTKQYQQATGIVMAAFCPGVEPADYFLQAN